MDEKFTRKITQDDFITEKNDIIKNHLLGNYDDNNEYHISEKIVEELISIEKLKKSSFGNSVFCVGNLLGYGEIVFEVVYDNKTSNTSAQAFLFVLENVDKINGYLQNTIRTQIAHFTSDIEGFIEESYEKFNIVGTLDDEGRVKKNLDEMSLDDSYILAKKAYSLLLDKLADEKVLDAYGKYFTSRLAILTKFDNPFTNDVLSRFNEEYALIQGVFLQQKNYKTLNELLDKCIEEASGIKEEYIKYEEEFASATKGDLDKFILNMQTINEKSEDKAIDMLDKHDREKIKEILSSNEGFEKDLSSEEMMNSNAIAPLQSMETLGNEIEELIQSENIDVNALINNSDNDDTVQELVNEEPVLEDFDREDLNNSQDNNITNPILEEEDSDEQDEEVEEISEEEAEDIMALFRQKAVEDVNENDDVYEDVNESDDVYEDIKDDIVDLIDDPSVSVDEMGAEEIVDLAVEEAIEESVNEVIDNKEVAEEVVDTLQSEFKENTSISIYDRLNKLKSNMKNTTKEYQTPKVKTGDSKLDKLYDLLDRSMDR